MQPRNTPAVTLKDVLLWSLFLPAVGALQQQPYDAAIPSRAGDRLSVADRFQAQDSLRAPLENQRRFKDTHVDSKDRSRSKSRSRTRTSSPNERALATYAPAESAVRAHSAFRSASSTAAGLTSRQPARSLQDWQVEDIILLATVDGKLHARDRTTGAARWQLEVDRPMVETIYYRHNRSVDESGLEQEDPLWIVEPSQDGSIYVYAPSSGFGMQKLGYTVKQLAELAPFAGEGQPALTYTAEKKNTLYTIDAGTGNVLKVFSSSGSITNEDRSCRRVNPLESLDDEECEPMGTLTLGRTEYIIGVQDRNTGEQISTIKYFEWGPNNRDQDLQSKYTTTMDRKYVYARHDGSVLGIDLADRHEYRPVPADKPRFQEKFTSPVARVYDVVRPSDDQSTDASLVVLPQPVGPSWSEFKDLEEDAPENVFVNCTEAGS
ncbi:kinase-like protein, partial [Hortaea werneckii]